MMFQPNISIGIICNDGFGLTPIGNWDISSSDDGLIFTPIDADALMEVKGVTIGNNFHWQDKKTFRYKGTMKVIRNNHSPATLVNVLPLEQYLQSVVCSEMSATCAVEFIRAHTIISRSWALRKLQRGRGRNEGIAGRICSDDCIRSWEESSDHRDSGYDFCSDDHCQRYQGVEDITEHVAEAVRSTEGIVLADAEGEIADTRFSKCCGGTTEKFSSCWEEHDHPYLTIKSDPFCDPIYARQHGIEKQLKESLKGFDSATEYFSWEETVSDQEIEENIGAKFGRNIGKILEMEISEKSASGRAVALLLKGEKGELTIGKELMIRRLLSDSHLKSSYFSIGRDKLPGRWRLKGKGWGHGVGLCQIGAAAMALTDFSAEEILAFYYPGTKLIKLY